MNWLDSYEARLRAATWGPWTVEQHIHEDSVENRISTRYAPPALRASLPVVTLHTCTCEPRCRVYISEADAEFIASSPEMVAHLLRATRLAVAALESIREDKKGTWEEQYDLSDRLQDKAARALEQLEHCKPKARREG